MPRTYNIIAFIDALQLMTKLHDQDTITDHYFKSSFVYVILYDCFTYEHVQA